MQIKKEKLLIVNWNLAPLRSAIGMLEYWNTEMMGWRPSDK
jgi:hypothetical protein